MDADVIVIGAGVAGLACAGSLTARGAKVVVLERSTGVGGRVATRRLDDGQVVDHGVGFLHGRDPDLLAELGKVDGKPLPGWPVRIAGDGPPCQPEAYDPTHTRLAFAEGVNLFAKHLAKGLDVRRETDVERLSEVKGGVAVEAGGKKLVARDVVLAVAWEQGTPLLAGLGEAAAPLRKLDGRAGTVPCLTVIAVYGPGAPVPDFDILHPGQGSFLQNVLHDSAKRGEGARRVLVLQSLPSFAKLRLSRPPESWGHELLEDAGRAVGAWAATPVEAYPHRWTYARVAAGTTRPAPVTVELPSGGRLSACGESFSPEGGVQAAFRSGRALAEKLRG